MEYIIIIIIIIIIICNYCAGIINIITHRCDHKSYLN